MSVPNDVPSTPSATTAGTTSERATARWWRVKFTHPGRPPITVRGDELDPYYRRNDVFEITPTPAPHGDPTHRSTP